MRYRGVSSTFWGWNTTFSWKSALHIAVFIHEMPRKYLSSYQPRNALTYSPHLLCHPHPHHCWDPCDTQSLLYLQTVVLGDILEAMSFNFFFLGKGETETKRNEVASLLMPTPFDRSLNLFGESESSWHPVSKLSLFLRWTLSTFLMFALIISAL